MKIWPAFAFRVGQVSCTAAVRTMMPTDGCCPLANNFVHSVDPATVLACLPLQK